MPNCFFETIEKKRRNPLHIVCGIHSSFFSFLSTVVLTVEEKGSLFQAAAVWPVESVEQAVAAVATLAREPSLRARTTA